MSFANINESLQKAQAELEAKLQECSIAEELKSNAQVALIQAESRQKKARLEVRIYQERIDSLKEVSWNLRRESKI